MYTTRYEGVDMTAIVAKGDELLAAAGAGDAVLSRWIAAERARIEVARQARIRKPVEIAGVPLVIGEWYAVTARKRWSRKATTRHACQFVGRAGGDEDSLVFVAWAARAVKGPERWDSGRQEIIAIASIEAVKPIPEPTKIIEHMAAQKAEREERERRAEEYRALMKEASR